MWKLETISNLFEDKEIRSIWDSEKGEYYFSVVDIIGALTNANIPRNYWSDLYEKETKKSVLSKLNSLNYKYIDEKILEYKGVNKNE